LNFHNVYIPLKDLSLWLVSISHPVRQLSDRCKDQETLMEVTMGETT